MSVRFELCEWRCVMNGHIWPDIVGWLLFGWNRPWQQDMFLFFLICYSRRSGIEIYCTKLFAVLFSLFCFFFCSFRPNYTLEICFVRFAYEFFRFVFGWLFFFLSEKTSLIVIKHFYDAMMLVLLAALLDYIWNTDRLMETVICRCLGMKKHLILIVTCKEIEKLSQLLSRLYNQIKFKRNNGLCTICVNVRIQTKIKSNQIQNWNMTGTHKKWAKHPTVILCYSQIAVCCSFNSTWKLIS